MENLFQDRLKAVMAQQRLNQVALAALVDTTQSTVNRWLHGSVPRGNMARRLCAALGVANKWLIEGRGDMESVPVPQSSIKSLEIRMALKNIPMNEDLLGEIVTDARKAEGQHKLDLYEQAEQLSSLIRRALMAIESGHPAPDHYEQLKAAEDHVEYKTKPKN